MIGRLLLIIWLVSFVVLIYFIYPVVWPKRNPDTGLNKLVVIKNYNGFATIQSGYVGDIPNSLVYDKSKIILQNISGFRLSGLESKSERFFITGYPVDIKTIKKVNYREFAVKTWEPLSYVAKKENEGNKFFYTFNNFVLIMLSILFIFKSATTKVPKF